MKFTEEIEEKHVCILKGNYESPCTTCKEPTLFFDVLWEGLAFCSTECLEEFNEVVAKDLERLNKKLPL